MLLINIASGRSPFCGKPINSTASETTNAYIFMVMHTIISYGLRTQNVHVFNKFTLIRITHAYSNCMCHNRVGGRNAFLCYAVHIAVLFRFGSDVFFVLICNGS